MTSALYILLLELIVGISAYQLGYQPYVMISEYLIAIMIINLGNKNRIEYLKKK